MSHTFQGGVHPDDSKSLTNQKPIEQLPPPEQVILPMSMHIGAPCKPIVAVGDHVCLGQRIAEAAAPGWEDKLRRITTERAEKYGEENQSD